MKRLPTRRYVYTASERGNDPQAAYDPWIVALPCETIPARRWFGAIVLGLLLACLPALVGCDAPGDHVGPDELAHVRQGHSVARVSWGAR